MAALSHFAIVSVRTNFRFSQHTKMLRLAHVETFGLIGGSAAASLAKTALLVQVVNILEELSCVWTNLSGQILFCAVVPL